MERKRLILVIIAVVVALWVTKAMISPKPAQTKANSSPAVGGWQISTETDPMTDKPTVDASTDADNDIQGWVQSTRPSLHVGCKNGEMHVYVWTGTAASVESDYDGGVRDGHTVELRLDDSQPIGEEWVDSDDQKALFAPSDDLGRVEYGTNTTQDLVVQLVKAKTLLFQFTPFNANPVIAHFNLQGLDKHIDQITKACGWTVE